MASSFGMLSICLLGLLLVGTSNGIAEPSSPDLVYMMALKQVLSDPYHHLQNWSNNSFPCTFNGIKCDNNSTHVAEIDLGNFGLVGPFPSVIGSLQNLTFLSLANNSITGEIPKDLTRCTNLKHLNLSQNYLTGPLPGYISELSSLEVLDLSGNNFSGTIPLEFAQFKNLQTLDLYYNLLGGTIPGFLGNLTNLVYLRLTNNPFDGGVIPLEIGKMVKLQQIWLSQCNLQGEIPGSIGGLAELQQLDFSQNNLNGAWHGFISNLVKLRSLQLYSNRLKGGIPTDIGKMSYLELIDASFNELTGQIPQSVGNLSMLKSLHLMNNNLSGEIPASLEGLTMLSDLSLFNNSFHGQIPQKLGSNTQFSIFDLSSNQLSGSLPSQLCNGGKLLFLNVFDNMLNGSISTLRNCSSLERLRLTNNQFSGEVPKDLWGSPGLSLLQLSSNKFEGNIPTDIGSAKSLRKLEIDDNYFSGKLPSEIGMINSLSFLNASNNKFSGSLPDEFDGLNQLEILDLSGNSLSGAIFSNIGSLRRLTLLSLKQNDLSGEIPVQIGSLQSLIYLDLSNNYLSGQVPASLAGLHLNFFNLSSNQLSGTVPSGLSKYKGTFLDDPQLCGEGFSDIKSCAYKKNHLKLWILCVILSCAAIVLVVGLGCFYKKYFYVSSVKDKEKIDTGPWNVVTFHKLLFHEQEIVESLNEASVIATGGAGKVYRVNLESGETLAVKRLPGRKKTEDLRYDSGFKAEIETLGVIRHKNIVKLWCCISTEDSNLLVYEYMPNGSIGDILHGPKPTSLDWPTRHMIALDSAQGISYLHHDCSPPIIHRDIKSNNILLDKELHAHVADFGLAMILEKYENGSELMSTVAGSYGYIAPEFSYSLKATTKSDVYSFGVVLLELVTGKRPIDTSYGEGANIVKWVSRMLEKENGLQEILDLRSFNFYRESILSVLGIALHCTNSLPANRPTMRNVVEMLQDTNPHQKSNV
ncbi:receptor-like protein kinase HSL1 [Cryptomeria japonica]|uniref:receptor-like protein kinase HSL1 n=1 Tax=Cryptomeria japonica TaxID=3369 RepID=UPI0025ABE23F|nr:receptor-like protein kinase HSL1 [Cryptomeria japonica]